MCVAQAAGVAGTYSTVIHEARGADEMSSCSTSGDMIYSAAHTTARHRARRVDASCCTVCFSHLPTRRSERVHEVQQGDRACAALCRYALARPRNDHCATRSLRNTSIATRQLRNTPIAQHADCATRRLRNTPIAQHTDCATRRLRNTPIAQPTGRSLDSTPPAVEHDHPHLALIQSWRTGVCVHRPDGGTTRGARGAHAPPRRRPTSVGAWSPLGAYPGKMTQSCRATAASGCTSEEEPTA